MKGARERRAGPGSIRRAARQLELLVPTFREIRAHRPLMAPLLLVGLLSVTSVVSLRPHLAGAFGGAGSGLPAPGVQAWLWLTALLSPLLMGGKAVVLAAVSWSVLALAGRDVRLRPLLSIYLYGEALLSVHGVATALLLHLRGRGAVSTPADLYVPMGPEVLVPSGWPLVAAVARGATLFHLAWFVFLVAALVRVVRVDRKAGIGAAAVSWFLVLSVSGVRALALG